MKAWGFVLLALMALSSAIIPAENAFAQYDGRTRAFTPRGAMERGGGGPRYYGGGYYRPDYYPPPVYRPQLIEMTCFVPGLCNIPVGLRTGSEPCYCRDLWGGIVHTRTRPLSSVIGFY